MSEWEYTGLASENVELFLHIVSNKKARQTVSEKLLTELLYVLVLLLLFQAPASLAQLASGCPAVTTASMIVNREQLTNINSIRS